MNQQFILSTFEGVGDTRPRQITCTWAQLCKSFASPRIRQEKDGLLFSPARYRAARRLIANVIELSLLVLEVDGAWRCDDCDHQGPLVMFRNRRHDGDECPKCKKANKAIERLSPLLDEATEVVRGKSISQIQFDCASLAAACRRAFPAAFALYSTHGHLRVTDSNTLAEPRFRIVIPLTAPVPVVDFLELWHAAVEALTEVPADPQVKDPNRIYYTPVKFSAESPYEFHIEPGEPLDWKKFVAEPTGSQLPSGPNEGPQSPAQPKGGGEACRPPDLFSTEQTAITQKVNAAAVFGETPVVASGAGVLPSAVSSVEPAAQEASALSGRVESGEVRLPDSGQRPTQVAAAPPALLTPTGIYASHEARHAEFCRRVQARAKLNSRGNYDARCLAHDGKGTTALLYNPRSGKVACNRGCDYFELLAAEGLDAGHLPSEDSLRRRQQNAVAATSPTGFGEVAAGGAPAVPEITLARLHVIYALMLAHCFEISPEDETSVRRYWGDPFSEEIEWPDTATKRRVKVCSFPSRRQQLEAVKDLSREFNLAGVPGFYRVPQPLPGPEGEQLRKEIAEYGTWRLALDQLRMRPGALLSPYDNGSGYICGIRIHRAIGDKCAFLLTSCGLPGGASAVAYREVAA